jgi:Zn finger protein HypA/HybF involved in hydrogenase expression
MSSMTWIPVTKPLDPADPFLQKAEKQIARYGGVTRQRLVDDGQRMVLERWPVRGEKACRCFECSAEWQTTAKPTKCPKCGERNITKKDRRHQ